MAHSRGGELTISHLTVPAIGQIRPYFSYELDELLELNKRIVLRIDYRHGLKTRAPLDRFEVGDRVKFQSEGRKDSDQ